MIFCKELFSFLIGVLDVFDIGKGFLRVFGNARRTVGIFVERLVKKMNRVNM